MKNPFAKKEEAAAKTIQVTAHKHGWTVSHSKGTKSFAKHQGDKAAAHILGAVGIPGAAEEAGEAEHVEE